MRSSPSRLEVPYRDALVENSGIASSTWQLFFRKIRDLINPIGEEKSYPLVNDVSVAEDVSGLSFDYRNESQAAVTYLIQRVTTGGGAIEMIETGTFYVAYLPTSNDWALVGGPSSAGVTLTITSDGQVQYSSTDETGTASIFKITWRASILLAKHSLYSKFGG